jgi:PAS domain S-box
MAGQTNGTHQTLQQKLKEIEKFHQKILDALPLHLSVHRVEPDEEYRLTHANKASLTADHAVKGDVMNKTLRETIGREHAKPIEEFFGTAIQTHKPIFFENAIEQNGKMYWNYCCFSPIFNAEGEATHIVGCWKDITARKDRELAAQKSNLDIIAEQASQLAELSTPILTISDTTLVMPLIGAIDSNRVQQILENLLAGVANTHATSIIIDITGVPVVDSQVADSLIRASQAVRLLGAQVLLTGIRPEVAQTLIGLGVDLSSIITLGSLHDGINYTLRN